MRPIRDYKKTLWKIILKKRGFGHSDILHHWDAIVGHQLAALCVPTNLSATGTLFVSATSECMMELHYKTPLILDRLATYLGRKAVVRFKVKADLPSPRPKKKALEKPIILPSEVEANLAGATLSIKSPLLRQRLLSLGRCVAHFEQNKRLA